MPTGVLPVAAPLLNLAAPTPPPPPMPAAGAAAPADRPAAAPAEKPAAAGAQDADPRLVAIKSPMVGTFYRSPSPDKPPFVKIGDAVDVGSRVCIIEAMKLFNEIESDIKGKIVKVLVDDSSPVEYDQPLFLVDPA
jgi:acetyl-CoA carboxylase biotin carboxyl carrier protein